jgi:hypothetical protein
MEGSLAELAANFGFPGLVLLWLAWDKSQDRALAKERIETDKALASSMSVLSAYIHGLKP